MSTPLTSGRGPLTGGPTVERFLCTKKPEMHAKMIHLACVALKPVHTTHPSPLVRAPCLPNEFHSSAFTCSLCEHTQDTSVSIFIPIDKHAYNGTGEVSR